EHLAGCAICRVEVDDLRQFQSQLKAAPRNVAEMPVRRSAWRIPAFVGIAAGMVLTVGLTFRMFRTQPQSLQTPQVAQQTPPPEPALSPDQQAAIQLALGTHTFEHAAVLDGLIARRSVLLGAPGEQKSFAINAPLGTVVLTDRPAFRWEMVAGAGSYVVAVFDDRFQKITESPAVTTTEWTPDQPLARGRIYNWQVTAHIGGRTLRSPVPPAPEARFQVAGADSALALENARREHPANHLLLAVLMAKAGALDDASRELDALAASDPANAESLRRSLKAIRGQ
ncbi:MAG: hypothetical protein JWP63_3410, partial [Candidatus Solibacter sp.]|nr:hypothetical protein [Candidatus Solibacter sp.]